MTTTRSSLIVMPLPCLFCLLIILVNVKGILTYSQQGLEHGSKRNIGDGLFMVGNSFMSMNNLTEIITNMMEQSSISASIYGVSLPLQTQTWVLDGAKWKEYAFQRGSQYHVPPPEKFDDALKRKEFRWVVLQEQSQIPGLSQSKYFQKEWSDSARAVELLDSSIQQFGNSDHTTQTILFQTWGRLTFDTLPSQLAEIFDSFAAHQSLIATGYKEYQRLVSTPERPVLVAPVGLAFQGIYDSMVKEGLDPSKEDGRFASLYQLIDGYHPSAQGSYLAASVLVGILTGLDSREFDWDYPLVPYDTQKYLREVAHSTIVKHCQSEYCNPKPTLQTISEVDPTDSFLSLLPSSVVRFSLFLAVVFVAVKRYNTGKKSNIYSR